MAETSWAKLHTQAPETRAGEGGHPAPGHIWRLLAKCRKFPKFSQKKFPDGKGDIICTSKQNSMVTYFRIVCKIKKKT